MTLVEELRDWLAEFGDASGGKGARIVRVVDEAAARIEQLEGALRTAREELQGYSEWLQDTLSDAISPPNFKVLARGDLPRVEVAKDRIDALLGGKEGA